MSLRYARLFFHALLWASAAVLLGLTAYRISYTKNRDTPDVLTDQTNYYDPIIVELLVTSCITILGSAWFIAVLAARLRAGGLGSFFAEALYLFIIFVMFLVGAAYATHEWLSLGWCDDRVCSILQTIKAFAFICWGLATLMLLWTLIDLLWTKSSCGDSAAGEGRTAKAYPAPATYPETRSAAPAPVSAQPAAQTTETTYTEVRAAQPAGV